MTYREFLRHTRDGIAALPGLAGGAFYVRPTIAGGQTGYCAVGAGLLHAGYDPAVLSVTVYAEDEDDLRADGTAVVGPRLPERGSIAHIIEANDGFCGTPEERRAYMLTYLDRLLDEEAHKAEHEGEPLVAAPPTLESPPVSALV